MLTVAIAQVSGWMNRNCEAGRGGTPVSLLDQAILLQALKGVEGQAW